MEFEDQQLMNNMQNQNQGGQQQKMSLLDVIKVQELGLKRLDEATLRKLEPILTRTINKLNRDLINQSQDQL